MRPPEVLDAVVDFILAYKPKPKGKKAQEREEERQKVETERRKKTRGNRDTSKHA